MDFQTTLENTDCECLKDTFLDITSTFVRRVGESSTLKLRDFKTHHERNKVPTSNACDDICGMRALSIEKYSDEWVSVYEKKRKTTSLFSPQNKYQMAKFILNDKAGVIKYTPDQLTGFNKFHYDLYKSAEFDVTSLNHLGFHTSV